MSFWPERMHHYIITSQEPLFIVRSFFSKRYTNFRKWVWTSILYYVRIDYFVFYNVVASSNWLIERWAHERYLVLLSFVVDGKCEIMWLAQRQLVVMEIKTWGAWAERKFTNKLITSIHCISLDIQNKLWNETMIYDTLEIYGIKPVLLWVLAVHFRSMWL